MPKFVVTTRMENSNFATRKINNLHFDTLTGTNHSNDNHIYFDKYRTIKSYKKENNLQTIQYYSDRMSNIPKHVQNRLKCG
jgi:hypothetical protein